MDKYEFNIKVEQIKKLVNKKDFVTAMKIADTIDWRRVRNANLLSMISQVYEKNGEYQEAKEVLLLAFERAPISKRLLYKLTELALLEGSIAEAEDYYREFCDLAPDDTRQHILRYMILREKDAPIDQLISSLERYLNTEPDEKWMYELAQLYGKAGRSAECVQLCDKMILLFGMGTYVEQAAELKKRYAPAVSYQRAPMAGQTYGNNGAFAGYGAGSGYDTGSGYGAGNGYGAGSGYGAGNGYDAGNSYGAENGYDSQGGYGVRDSYGSGYGAAYGAEAGYQSVPEEGNGYQAGAAYGTGTAYQAETGYGSGNSYGAENSYDTGSGYGAGGGYGTEAGYDAGSGYESQGAYGQETGGAYGAGNAYGQNNGYESGTGYGADPYQPETGYGNDPVYQPGGYGGGAGYQGEAGYEGGNAYGGEASYDAGSGYSGENPYQPGNGYGTEAAYQSGAGYSAETAYQQGAGYGNRAAGNQPSGNYGGARNQAIPYGTGAPYSQGGWQETIDEVPRAEAGGYRQDSYQNDGSYLEENRAYGSAEDGSYMQPEEGYGQPEGAYIQEDESYEYGPYNQEESYEYQEPQLRGNIQKIPRQWNGPALVPGVQEVDEEMMANLHQAVAEKELAAEMSRISTEDYEEPEAEAPVNRTRIFRGKGNIRPFIPRTAEEETPYYDRSYIPHHFMVEAKSPEKGFSVAVASLKKIHQETGVNNQVIKITGSKLSKRGVFNVSDKLAGKDLIIEEAGDLAQADLEQLQMLMERDETGMIVVLIDNPLQLRELRQKNPGFSNLFKSAGEEETESRHVRKETEETVQQSPSVKENTGTDEQEKTKDIKEAVITETKPVKLKKTSEENAHPEADARKDEYGEGNPQTESPESGYEDNDSEDSQQEEYIRDGQAEDEYSEDGHQEKEYTEDEYSEDSHQKEEYTEEEYPEGSDQEEEYTENECSEDSDREEEYNEDEYSEDDDQEDGYDEDEYPEDDDREEEYSEDEYSEDEYSEDDDPEEEYSDEEYPESEGEADESYEEDGDGNQEEYQESEPVDDEELDLDAFAEYAAQYASEIDCSITGKSMLALYERIESMEEDGIPLTRANAEDLIEEAADKAEKPSLSGLIKGVFSSKYDKDGLLILKEEHFI